MEKVKVNLTYIAKGKFHTDTIYVYGEHKEIETVLNDTKDIIRKWWYNKETIPTEYSGCDNEHDFYQRALELNFKVEYDYCDYEIDWTL